MSYTIEKNVPVPMPGGGRNIKYPFRDMEVGDSFACDYGVASRLRSAASQFGIRNGRLYKVRKVTEGELVVGRCWRVE